MKQIRNRLLEFFSKRKIRQQLYMIYIVAVLLPIVVIGSFLIGNTGKLLTEYYENLLESDNLRVKTILFEITSQVYNISETIIFEDSLQEILSLKGEPEDQNYAYSYTTLNNYISNHAEIEDIVIYTDNPYAANYMHFEKTDEEIRSRTWYQKAMEQAGAFWTPVKDVDKYGNEYWNLALIRRITVMNNEEQAVLVMKLSDNYLQTRISSNEYRIHALCEEGPVFYDSSREHYGEEETIYIDRTNDYYQYTGMVWQGAKKVFTKVSTLRLYQSKSKIYIITMHDKAYSDIRGIILTNLLIVAIAAILPGILIHYFTKYFTNRVSLLRDQMKKVSSGDYDDNPFFGGEDELSETYSDLQVMVDVIKKKDAKMYETILSEQKLLNEQQVIEMKMLASQINPHFLYNTLESIRMQAVAAGNKEVANSIKLLGKSMRYVLENTGTAMVTLKKELDYVLTYLQIQKIRFGSKFDYKIEVSDEIQPDLCMILPILIQPVVENAILHGLEEVEEGGLITVKITLPHENILQVEVTDNGSGMDRETLENLRESIKKNTTGRQRSIGLANIHKRIRLCHGEEYGMTVDSTIGSGTVITLRLPYKPAE